MRTPSYWLVWQEMVEEMSCSLDCVYCSSYITYLLRILNSMSKSLNQTLFNKYSGILQPNQMCQVGEYPCVKIHNFVGTKIPVTN